LHAYTSFFYVELMKSTSRGRIVDWREDAWYLGYVNLKSIFSSIRLSVCSCTEIVSDTFAKTIPIPLNRGHILSRVPSPCATPAETGKRETCLRKGAREHPINMNRLCSFLTPSVPHRTLHETFGDEVRKYPQHTLNLQPPTQSNNTREDISTPRTSDE